MVYAAGIQHGKSEPRGRWIGSATSGGTRGGNHNTHRVPLVMYPTKHKTRAEQISRLNRSKTADISDMTDGNSRHTHLHGMYSIQRNCSSPNMKKKTLLGHPSRQVFTPLSVLFVVCCTLRVPHLGLT